MTMTTANSISDDLPACQAETRVVEAFDFASAASEGPPVRIEVHIPPTPPTPPRRYLRPSAHWADRWLTVTRP